MLHVILNKSSKQHLIKQLLHDLLPPISKTIQIRNCWRSKDNLMNDVLLWTPSHGRVSIGRPTIIYLQLLCTDTGRSLEDLLGAMDDWDEWRERERERERESGKFMQAAQLDDDDEEDTTYSSCSWTHLTYRFPNFFILPHLHSLICFDFDFCSFNGISSHPYRRIVEVVFNS